VWSGRRVLGSRKTTNGLASDLFSRRRCRYDSDSLAPTRNHLERTLNRPGSILSGYRENDMSALTWTTQSLR
jgi:hypothetical protein